MKLGDIIYSICRPPAHNPPYFARNIVVNYESDSLGRLMRFTIYDERAKELKECSSRYNGFYYSTNDGLEELERAILDNINSCQRLLTANQDALKHVRKRIKEVKEDKKSNQG